MPQALPADQAIFEVFLSFLDRMQNLQAVDPETRAPLVGQAQHGDSRVAAAILTQSYFQVQLSMQPPAEEEPPA